MHPVYSYPAELLAALRAAAPAGTARPGRRGAHPGTANAAYFEHALLARLMGVELVEGGDLTCAGNRVYVHTTQGLRPVDVIYRRVDDDFLDPLQFRPDSVIGCPGIINAARAGHVTIANAVGNGVADDKLLYTWVPDLIRYYLREQPLLDNVESYRLDDPERLHWVLGHLDQLVLKPVDGAGGSGIVIGPRADEATLDALRTRVAAQPRGWIAQQPVALSTSPVLIGETLAPRHIDLRPFAVNNGNDVWLLPGGLTRVALPEGELVVNSSRGGGSKDTWVLVPPGEPESPGAGPAVVSAGDRPARRWFHLPRCRARSRSTGRAGRPWKTSNDQRPAQQDRRDAVLDRPVHRACRRHRPHGRRVRAPDARASRTPTRRPTAARCSRSSACRPQPDARLDIGMTLFQSGVRRRRTRARSPAR